MALTDLHWVRWCAAHWRRMLVLLFGSVVPLLAFAAIAEDVVEHEPFAFDQTILGALHAAAAPGYDVLMRAASQAGHSWGVVPLDIVLALLLLAQRRWAHALFWILAVGGTGCINWIAKQLFARERPALWDVIARPDTYGFPSGHAMGSMAAMAALVVMLWPTRWRYPILLFAVPFGGCRAYTSAYTTHRTSSQGGPHRSAGSSGFPR
jgi:undecaprenyl-diphosphatase